MGFGAYDESEQERQEYKTDEDNAGQDTVENDSADHNGDVEFDFESSSTEDLVDQLQEMKEEDE